MPCRLLLAGASIALIFLVSLPTSAQDKKERTALRAISSLYVSLVLEKEAPGFDDTRFLLETRQRLERGGLLLSTSDKLPAQTLRLSILPKYDDHLKVYLVVVTLELLKLTVTAAGNTEFSAMWMRRDVLAAEKWSSLRDAANELVDEFITDWKTARSGISAMPPKPSFVAVRSSQVRSAQRFTAMSVLKVSRLSVSSCA